MRFIAALAALAILGCSAQSDVYKITIRQVALLPAPAGPHAMGPLLAEGHFAVEGGVSLAPPWGGNGSTASSSVSSSAPGNSRDNGAPGEVMASAVVNVRASYGFRNWLEGGLDLEYAHPSFGSPLASDISSSSLNGGNFWRMGAQLRGIFLGNRHLGLGFNLELSFGFVPYGRTVDTETTSTCESSPCTGATTYSTYTTSWNDLAFVPFARGGVFVTGQPFPSLTLSGGVLAQDQPFFFGSGQFIGSCFYPAGSIFPSNCGGIVDPSQIPSFSLDPVATAWVSASLSVGRVTLTGQFFGHFAGPARTIDPAPVGGSFSARVDVL